MNYRHAFHAGNFADVMKHVVLTRVLLHLRRKETPFRVIDTHAGIGLYDLAADEALRTGEWRDGIGRLETPLNPDAEALLAPYREVLARMRQEFGADAYPGSPAIARDALRAGDRAIFVELHPDDGALLARRFNRGRSKVLHLDGWTALHGLIPPPERRGLVLIDPPYEDRDELVRLAGEVTRAVRKWPTGIFALWYPIKATGPVDGGGVDRRPARKRAAPRLAGGRPGPPGPTERLRADRGEPTLDAAK
jgi:23S rRNA (adenine2030-N6)-methyltransferase